MTLPPIIERELKLEARRPSTYHVRVLLAGGALVVCVWMSHAVTSQNAGALGLKVFVTLSSLMFGYAALVGIFTTADCLSQERREGTLGLLFLTPLNAFEVVLSKLVTAAMNPFYALLAVLPLLGLCTFVGGVTGDQFLHACVAVINMFLLSISLGLLVSTVGRSMLWVRWVTAAGVATLCLLPLLMGKPGGKLGASWALHLSPFYPLALSWELTSHQAGCMICSSGMVGGSFSLLFVAVATLTLSRTWQDGRWFPLLGRITEAKLRKHLLRKPLEPTQEALLLAGNPVLWNLNRGLQPVIAAGFAPLGAWLAGVGICVAADRNPFELENVFLMTIAANTVFKITLTLMATPRLRDDRDSGILELLLTTPLRTWQVTFGQRWALEQQFFKPLLANLAVTMAMWLTGLMFAQNIWEVFITSAGIAASMVFLLFDCHALSWLALWRGLKANSSLNGSAQALLWGLGGPLAAGLLAMGLLHLARELALFVFVIWVGIRIGWAMTCAEIGKQELHKQIRQLASVPPAPGHQAPFWERWAGRIASSLWAVAVANRQHLQRWMKVKQAERS